MFPFQKVKNDIYNFYYDESNNVRKLYLSKQIDGYNVDHDEEKNTGVNFILGGIAFKGEQSNADFDKLKKMVMLQPTAKEIKLKQIATGDFVYMLNSKKLTGFIQWLLDSDLYIHYFNLNMEYWAYLDIIEDCILFCQESNFLTFNNIFQFREYQDIHKNELYKVVLNDKLTFIKLLKKFDYPYLTGKEAKFLDLLNKLVLSYYKKVNTYPLASNDDKLKIDSLRELFEICIDNGMDDFTLTMDHRFDEEVNDKDNYLVDAFSIFYRYRAMDFSESKHLFDVEEVVKDDFTQQMKHDEELAELDFEFIASENNYFIQVSDVVAGLFQRYFNFLNVNRIEDVKHIRETLNPIQEKNMMLFQSLINKSDDENKKLLFYVMSMMEYYKHRAFTYPENN